MTTDQAASAERWDRHFLHLSLDHARMSKDPRTRVGSVITGPDRELRSAGFNGLPRGIADTHARLHDKAMKLRLVVHGEMNAILAAAIGRMVNRRAAPDRGRAGRSPVLQHAGLQARAA
jgi:deoxycytidylate deaminase